MNQRLADHKLTTELAAYLMGIHDSEHLSIHSARGVLFENFVIGELLKSRFNNGLPSNFYFWRNNIGNEIDVIIEHGNQLQPVEIKSGQTITADHLVGIKKWLGIASGHELSPYLIYGGV